MNTPILRGRCWLSGTVSTRVPVFTEVSPPLLEAVPLPALGAAPVEGRVLRTADATLQARGLAGKVLEQPAYRFDRLFVPTLCEKCARHLRVGGQEPRLPIE